MLYKDGKPESTSPKPCAGKFGTIISVQDLFYNNPTRRKAIKNFADEYQAILRVIRMYALHNSGVSFSVKRMNETLTDLHTNVNATELENIKQVCVCVCVRVCNCEKLNCLTKQQQNKTVIW
jgi:DNA mismatch repair protein MLH1